MEIVRSTTSIDFVSGSVYARDAAARIRAPDNVERGGGEGRTVINHGGFGSRNREKRREKGGGGCGVDVWRLEKSERRRYITPAISLLLPLSFHNWRDGIVAPLTRQEGTRRGRSGKGVG